MFKLCSYYKESFVFVAYYKPDILVPLSCPPFFTVCSYIPGVDAALHCLFLYPRC